jgi:putative ABC transport system permease protein
MLRHDLMLALESLKRNPVLSALMIFTIAVGIAASMIATTLYHARAGHPIPWKDDTLYAVTLDPRDNTPPQSFERHPEYPPFNVTYLDAAALYASSIPRHTVMMYQSVRLLTPSKAGVRPFQLPVRVTTADFFTAFDVPFLYGGRWTRADDDKPAAVIVISRSLNQKLFSGANSVGREVVLSGVPYRVAGVLAAWMPQPRYYDLNGSGFDVPEDLYMPFGWMRAQRMMPNGVNCVSNRAKASGFDSLLTQDCVWLQYWVELKSRADLPRFQAFVDAYTDDQRAHGRFPRPRNNNRIVNVPAWLAMWDVVGDDSRLQLALGFVFLAVCVLNTLGLLLAKFLGTAPVSGLRRALGARRVDIVRAHVTEAGLLSLLGGALGIALTFCGLAGLRVLVFGPFITGSDNPDYVSMTQALVHMDGTVLLVAIALSLLTGILAGLYPAWRIGRLAPATFLKTQ